MTLAEALARGLRFLARDAAVMIGVETVKHSRARRGEFIARELAVAVSVQAAAAATPVALAAIHPAPLVARAHLGSFVGRDRAVIIGVERGEHLQRAGQEFVARDCAVAVRIGPAPAVMRAAAAPVFAAFQVAVVIFVQAREPGVARGVELGARHRTVIVGVRLEQMIDAAPMMFLSRGPASEQRRTGHSKKDRAHEIYSE
jgi:hypothetical protein